MSRASTVAVPSRRGPVGARGSVPCVPASHPAPHSRTAAQPQSRTAGRRGDGRPSRAQACPSVPSPVRRRRAARPAPRGRPPTVTTRPSSTGARRPGKAASGAVGRPWTATRCSINCLVTATLHRFGDFLPSTYWGLRSCPELRPQGAGPPGVCPAQVPVDSWTNDLHRLWTKRRSTGCARSCPRTTHRLGAVVPSDGRLLHMAVHCSATRRPLSPRRVKGVTRRCRVGVWETWVNLGTQLGRTALDLWAVCAELLVLHRHPGLSTGSTHRGSGQNLGPELGKRGYPRYPQALLLLPTRDSWETVSKRGLCTTRRLEPGCPPERLDPDRHLLSVRCVRLVPGVLPFAVGGDTESEDSVATAGGGLR